MLTQSSNNTIVIERVTKSTQSVALQLPYYAQAGSVFYAIEGETNNLVVSNWVTLGASWVKTDFPANELPEKHEQISESMFMQEYEKAMLLIAERFLASCPNARAEPVQLKEAA